MIPVPPGRVARSEPFVALGRCTGRSPLSVPGRRTARPVPPAALGRVARAAHRTPLPNPPGRGLRSAALAAGAAVRTALAAALAPTATARFAARAAAATPCPAARPASVPPTAPAARPAARASRTALLLGVALAALLPGAPAAEAQDVPSPGEFFGFEMGADRQLARWDRMVEYYRLLERSSDRLVVEEMGPTTLGNPFLVLFVSSPANLARLEELRATNARLTDPRGASQAELDRAVEAGRAVVVQSYGLHSNEAAGCQTAVEVAWELVSRDDEDVRRILDEVVTVLFPCFNPDGEIMVTDWYRRTVGTGYEGADLPWLYHPYAGHDNNRDAFQQNLVESRYGARILFRDWVPQAYVDHHQMGSYGARMFVPPYADPVRPSADPLVWREMAWYGAHMAYKEEEAGLSGVINAAIYPGWGHLGFHWLTPFHNTAGMLTESASPRLATPLFLHPGQLRGGVRGLPEYQEQTTFPNPWRGGWWRLRDVVERQKVASLAVLDHAARNRETVLRNAYLKALRQTERGREGRPAAYVIPARQHDPLTAVELVNKLLAQGIEVHRSPGGFTHDGKVQVPGTYVVSMAQPKMGAVRWLLGRTLYPDNSHTRDRDGVPIGPYDMATDNMAEFMGVQVEASDEPVHAVLEPLGGPVEAQGRATLGAFGYLLDGRLNETFRAVNLLVDRGVAVRRVHRLDAPAMSPGDFVVAPSAPADAVAEAAGTGVFLAPLESDATAYSAPLRRLRTGVYQRYWGGNMDEGWTRWLLERYGFPYRTVMDEDLRSGDLRERYDVILLPTDTLARLLGDEYGPVGGGSDETPPEYRSGMGREGVAALHAFVRAGGILVTFGSSGTLPIREFGLPIRNAVEGLPSTRFWSPGSTLRVQVDPVHPLAYGMPPRTLATFLTDNQAYEILPTIRNERVDRIVNFADQDLLQSGWLVGQDALVQKAAMVSVEVGAGEVVLIGFRPQHRAQTHGTFKLVFNALMRAGEEVGEVTSPGSAGPGR